MLIYFIFTYTYIYIFIVKDKTLLREKHVTVDRFSFEPKGNPCKAKTP